MRFGLLSFKKIVLFAALLLCICSITLAQANINVKLFSEKENRTIMLYADNNELCPVSLELKMELNNLTSSNGNEKVFVIPAKAQKFLITQLTPTNPTKGSGYKSQYLSHLGDVTINKTTVDSAYQLPYLTNQKFVLSQGYNGSFSHKNENALDFTMPEGTTICAARSGIVVKVVQQHNRGCGDESCKQYNNQIMVYHNDGSFTEYLHLKYNGALVREGDIVNSGQAIGYSGNTGWSIGPHLHFVAFYPQIKSRQTIKTRFKINDGKQEEYLTEKVAYSKNY